MHLTFFIFSMIRLPANFLLLMKKFQVEKPPRLIFKLSGYFDYFCIILTLLTVVRQTELISYLPSYLCSGIPLKNYFSRCLSNNGQIPEASCPDLQATPHAHKGTE